MVEPDKTNDSIIRRMRFECWIFEAADVSLEYVILLGNQSYGQKIINIFN